MPLTSYIFLSAAQKRLLHAGRGIFVFHKVADSPPQTRDPFEFVSPSEFGRKLAAVKIAGFQPVELNDFDTAPAGRFIVTFDDGYSNLIRNALPVLQQQNIRAITYLIAGKLGGRNDWDIAKGDVSETLMDEAQVRTWLAAGHKIGSHSLTHPNLRKISTATAREEISASRKKLEDTFGIAVEHFCYPYGSYTEAIRDMVADAGYRTASTVKHGVHLPGDSPFELKRLVPLTAGELLRKIIHRAFRRCGLAR